MRATSECQGMLTVSCKQAGDPNRSRSILRSSIGKQILFVLNCLGKAVQLQTAHLQLADSFRHVTTKPADLAGHPVACGCASPISGPASRKELCRYVKMLHAAKCCCSA